MTLQGGIVSKAKCGTQVGTRTFFAIRHAKGTRAREPYITAGQAGTRLGTRAHDRQMVRARHGTRPIGRARVPAMPTLQGRKR
ncbi:Uncharacterised protein [Mycobacteroides abscessus subsp. abscessus]|nr:Uncharacterised protein [Mycobacteroides abscessus subsp. abscessus]